MTPAPGRRAGLGWAIMIAALAVPGILFYNWWSRLKDENDRGASTKARARAEGEVFQTPPPSARLVNPMAASAAPIAARIAPAAPKPVAAPAAAPAPSPIVPAPVVPVPPARVVPAAPVALSSAAAVVLSRDPMMSPLDRERIEEERKRLLELAARKDGKRARKASSIDSRIALQGIVSRSDGANLAIINGETVNPGGSFAVAGYPGKVRILTISATGVTLEYMGRKIKKRMNAN